MNFLKGLLLCLFLTACFCVVYSCSQKDADREYFEVVEFNYDKADATIYTKDRIIDKFYIYEMKVVNENKDTVDLKFGSDEVYRFFPGDTIYKHFSRYFIKK